MSVVESLKDNVDAQYRLTQDDQMMYEMDKAGFRFPMQLVYSLDTSLDKERLELVNDHIASSGLAKIHFPARVPGVPGFWGRSERKVPVDVTEDVLHAHEVQKWLDTQITLLPKDCSSPGWKVSGANIVGGKSVVSICVGHHIADGHGGLQEIYSISQRIIAGDDPVTHKLPQEEFLQRPALERIISDVKLLPSSVLHKAALYTFFVLPGRINKRVYKLLRKKDAPQTNRSYTAIFPTSDFSHVATQHQGNITSLAAAIVTNVMHTIDPKSKTLQGLTIPVDLRTDPTVTSNQVTSVFVPMSDIPKPIGELGEIKLRCRQEYKKLGERPPSMNRRIGVAVSNVGAIPDEIGKLFPHCNHVYGRAVAYCDDHVRTIIPGGLFIFVTIYQDYLSFTATEYNLTQNYDLREYFHREYSTWGLVPREVFADATL